MARYTLKNVEVRLKLDKIGSLYSDKPINSPETAKAILEDVFKQLDREVCATVNLDAKGHPINYNIVSMGSLNSSIVSVSNVFKAAILSNSAFIMMLHNHPSGDLSPSKADIDITKRVALMGYMMQIPLIDHLIVGYDETLSLKAAMPDVFDNKDEEESRIELYDKYTKERIKKPLDTYEKSHSYGERAWDLGRIIMAMNNEDAYYGNWLYLWPDGDQKEDIIDEFSDKDDYKELFGSFRRVYKAYHKDGLFTEDEEVVKLAHYYDKKFGLLPIENTYENYLKQKERFL